MEFWKSAGLHLVERNGDGKLRVTDDLLRAYYTRPEIHPVEESCRQEHEIFERLMAEPTASVSNKELKQIADQDTSSNYRVVLGFRDHLLAYETLEAAYTAYFVSGVISVPPIFLDQIVHLILANIFIDEKDPMQLRVAELFFREQIATTHEETLMLADEEIVEMRGKGEHLGGLGQLIVEAGTAVKEVSLEVLDEENKSIYWERSDQFDTAIDFRFTQPAPDAFARVLEKWVAHFHGIETRVQARQSIQDERWTWHIGCDATSTQILNDLYNGDDVTENELQKIVGLFRMEFLNQADVVDTMQGKPLYLGLAMDDENRVKVKPQNLLTNLPLAKN